MGIMSMKQKKKHTQRHKPDQGVKVRGNDSRTGSTA